MPSLSKSPVATPQARVPSRDGVSVNFHGEIAVQPVAKSNASKSYLPREHRSLDWMSRASRLSSALAAEPPMLHPPRTSSETCPASPHPHSSACHTNRSSAVAVE